MKNGEYTSMTETLNIAWNNHESEEARILSNLAHTPFDLHGTRWASIEAFWKSLYLPEEERKNHAHKFGISAWKIFIDKPYPKTILYQGKEIEVGSTEHRILFEIALRAKIRQNSNVMEALRRTKEAVYVHVSRKNNGELLPPSKTVPGDVFAHMLTVLRGDILESNLL